MWGCPALLCTLLCTAGSCRLRRWAGPPWAAAPAAGCGRPSALGTTEARLLASVSVEAQLGPLGAGCGAEAWLGVGRQRMPSAGSGGCGWRGGRELSSACGDGSWWDAVEASGAVGAILAAFVCVAALCLHL